MRSSTQVLDSWIIHEGRGKKSEIPPKMKYRAKREGGNGSVRRAPLWSLVVAMPRFPTASASLPPRALIEILKSRSLPRSASDPHPVEPHTCFDTLRVLMSTLVCHSISGHGWISMVLQLEGGFSFAPLEAGPRRPPSPPNMICHSDTSYPRAKPMSQRISAYRQSQFIGKNSRPLDDALRLSRFRAKSPCKRDIPAVDALFRVLQGRRAPSEGRFAPRAPSRMWMVDPRSGYRGILLHAR